jgi:hypothetical protein
VDQRRGTGASKPTDVRRAHVGDNELLVYGLRCWSEEAGDSGTNTRTFARHPGTAFIRVFYDVTETAVEVLTILPKSEAQAWLERYGEADETGGIIGIER